MTLRENIHRIKSAIEPLYGADEATSIARMVVENRLSFNLSQLVARYDEECEIEDLELLVEDLKRGRPVQYILGEAEFCDLKLKVAEGVLIPRPETEELVYNIIQHAKPNSRILDIGTGSGAIAIALAHHIENAEVVAIDISEEALAIARHNVSQLGVAVQLIKADALGDLTPLGKFDIIVSNPPYIPQSDITTMRTNVVDFEPHGALFVPDNDALKFYRATAQNGRKMLRKGGSVWFEIYEEFGAEVCAELRKEGFSQCQIYTDSNLKERVVWATI